MIVFAIAAFSLGHRFVQRLTETNRAGRVTWTIPLWLAILSSALDNLRADPESVRVFVQVVESKTFRGAARTLGMPKSTVSFRVAALEDQLGERLLERTTRRLRLTEAGALYHRQARSALETLQEAERTLSERKAGPSGRLRVTATLEGGQFVFAPLFAEYARRYPSVELDVMLTDRHLDLIEEGIDVAIRSGPLPDSSFMARRIPPLGAMRCIASPLYLKTRGTPRRPGDLGRHDCLVMTSQSEPCVWKFEVEGKVTTVRVKPRAQANSFVVLAEFAKAGLGIARMPAIIASEGIAGGALTFVLDAFQSKAPARLHAIYPSARHLSSKVRALLELLEEQSPSC
jgi:DNA-binding transcriptional LysR family regulator